MLVLCTPGPVDGPFTSPAIAGPAPIATRASAPTPTAADFLSPTGSLLDRRSPVRADVRRLDLRATPLGCTGVDQVKKRSITAREHSAEPGRLVEPVVLGPLGGRSEDGRLGSGLPPSGTPHAAPGSQ